MIAVFLGISGVRHDNEALRARARDNEVVDNARLIVEEHGVFRPALSESSGIERAGARQEGGGIRAANLEKPHMGDIEQPRFFSCMKVLLHHAGSVAERHTPAGESAKARAGLLVHRRKGKVSEVAHRSSKAARTPLMRHVRAPLSEA